MSGRYIPVSWKTKIIKRANYRCEYCQSWMKNAIHTFHIDHVTPLDNGGKTEIDNLALSCGGCNSAKGSKTTIEDFISKLTVHVFNPRQEKWSKHFAWSDDFLEIIGLTPIGRASIKALRLNRKGVVNMRKLTILGGEHPPPIEEP